MRNSKLKGIMGIAVAATLVLSSCSSSLYSASSASNDDLYAPHNMSAIVKANNDRKERDIARLKAEQERQAILDAKLAELQSLSQSLNQESYSNPYDDVLSNSYEESYERRLKGFSSSTYKMPSSYYNYRYGDKAFYASAYDPAFYNVMVMGDQVWVEPKYISSMFGSWGGSVNVNLNFGFSRWGYPYNYWGNWGYPSYGWGYPNYGWGYPHYGWGYPHYGWGNGWGRPYYSKYNNNNTIFNRPRTNGSSTPSYQGGNTTQSYRRGSSSTPIFNGNPSSPQNSGNASTSYRRGSSSNNNNNNNNNINNNNNNSITTRRQSTTTTTPSYSSPSSSPSNSGGGFRGSSSGGGGGSTGGASSGGGGGFRR